MFVEKINSEDLTKDRKTKSIMLPFLFEKNKIVVKRPRRYIFTVADMEQFRSSQIRENLLTFVRVLGQSVKICNTYTFDCSHPLIGLSPPMACLHGSLQCMSGKWIEDIPRDDRLGGRFGNPAFRIWHDRLVKKSRNIVSTMMNCHKYMIYCRSDTEAPNSENAEQHEKLLEDLAKVGYESASSNDCSAFEPNDPKKMENKIPIILKRHLSVNNKRNTIESFFLSHSIVEYTKTNNQFTVEEEDAITELSSYFCLSFGHPVRIDFGTGHECSFLVFLYCLYCLGFFREYNDNLNVQIHQYQNSCTYSNIIQSPNSYISMKSSTNSDTMASVALSIFSQYLNVCRNIQSQYVLEPAGSRGVWGLDDYHCIPFFIGACQFQNPNLEVKYSPDCIHDNHLLRSDASDVYMYLGCTRHIKSLKKGAPFNESCPMLDDISRMKSWHKIANGLLRFYNVEVLDKLPVVQHFLFGNIFRATWKVSDISCEIP